MLRIYAFLCRCYPHAFRRQFERDMVADFAELLQETSRAGTLRAWVTLSTDVVWDVVRSLPAAHLSAAIERVQRVRRVGRMSTVLLLGGIPILLLGKAVTMPRAFQATTVQWIVGLF